MIDRMIIQFAPETSKRSKKQQPQATCSACRKALQIQESTKNNVPRLNQIYEQLTSRRDRMAGKIKARARARNSQHTQREWSTENVLFFQGGGRYGDNLHALSGKQHEKTNEHSIVFSVVSLTQTSTLIPKVHHSETKFYKHFCG